ncbi:MAG: TIGR04282 family arsenosugar biosynthesis glycosyltransferase, partial [Candidatus Acidiferrales bacterium]
MPVRRQPRAALVVFARAPQLGRVKTRLVPPLTPPQAHSFHIACIESTARLAASLPRSIEKWLYLTTEPVAGRRPRLPSSIRMGSQRGSDLGRRLEHAFRERQRAGAERAVVIGSDSPML